MKILQVLFLIFGLSIFASAQKVIVRGIIADETGAPISNTRLTATSSEGKIFKR